jgi:hypothetical protein
MYRANMRSFLLSLAMVGCVMCSVWAQSDDEILTAEVSIWASPEFKVRMSRAIVPGF